MRLLLVDINAARLNIMSVNRCCRATMCMNEGSQASNTDILSTLASQYRSNDADYRNKHGDIGRILDQSCRPLNGRRSLRICRSLDCKYGAGTCIISCRPSPVTIPLAGKRQRDITARLFCALIGSGSAGYFCNVDPWLQ